MPSGDGEQMIIDGQLTFMTALAIWIFLFLHFPAAVMILSSVVTIVIAISRRPMWGVYLLTASYSLQSCKLILVTSLSRYTEILWYELLSLILAIAMCIREATVRHRFPIKTLPFDHFARWTIYLVAGFFVWSFCKVLWTPYLLFSAESWWKLVSNFLIILFLYKYVDDFEKLVRILIAWVITSVVFGFSAFAATWYPFKESYPLIRSSSFSLELYLSLINVGGGTRPELVGLMRGIGLAAKHELSMLIYAGIASCVFLLTRYTGQRIRWVLIGTILFLQTVIFQIISRTGMLAVIGIIVALALTVTEWRQRIVNILVIALVILVFGFGFSQLLKTSHMKFTDSITKVVGKVVSPSAYEAGSLELRKRIWRESWNRFITSKGLGDGPESLYYSTTTPHAHNIVLSFAVDYGILGVLFVMCFFATVGTRIWRSVFMANMPLDERRVFRLCLVGAGIYAALEYSIDCFVWWPHLWYLLALLLVSVKSTVANAE